MLYNATAENDLFGRDPPSHSLIGRMAAKGAALGLVLTLLSSVIAINSKNDNAKVLSVVFSFVTIVYALILVADFVANNHELLSRQVRRSLQNLSFNPAAALWHPGSEESHPYQPLPQQVSP